MSKPKGRPRAGWRGITPYAPNTIDLFIEENVPDKLPEFVATLEEYGDRNETAKKFVAQYWALPRNKRRLGRVTLICREAGVSPIDVRKAFIGAKLSYAKDEASYERAKNLDKLMIASLESAKSPENTKHMERHLEAVDLIQQPKGPQTNIQLAQVSHGTALPSFEQMMADAERQIHTREVPALTGIVEGEVVEDGE